MTGAAGAKGFGAAQGGAKGKKGAPAGVAKRVAGSLEALSGGQSMSYIERFVFHRFYIRLE